MGLFVAKRRNQDHWRKTFFSVQALQHFKPAETGHPDVGDDQVDHIVFFRDKEVAEMVEKAASDYYTRGYNDTVELLNA